VRQVYLIYLLSPLIAWCQKPVIFPGGVVNAASYQAANTSSHVGVSLQGGSIVSIFGTNLATSTETATTIQLPTQLGGTTVTAFGVAVHLFYASQDQINFQMPSSGVAANPGNRGDHGGGRERLLSTGAIGRICLRHLYP
jgi:hypothetical protein